MSETIKTPEQTQQNVFDIFVDFMGFIQPCNLERKEEILSQCRLLFGGDEPPDINTIMNGLEYIITEYRKNRIDAVTVEESIQLNQIIYFLELQVNCYRKNKGLPALEYEGVNNGDK